VLTDSALTAQGHRPPHEVAIDVITEYLVDGDGILQTPIDPIALAEKIGLTVSLGDLDPGVGGLISKGMGAKFPMIILNGSDATVRQRFTAAHELGHFFRHGNAEAYGYVDRRDDLSSTGNDPAERWSNQFAAELLMPRYVVRKWFSEDWSLARMAKEFGVSDIAMTYRLKNLNLA
jgi:hypothetical protein